MTVTRDDAASALHDIDTAERKVLTAFRYWLCCPYLLLWGALWIIAGAAGAVSPENTGIGWLVVDIAGFIGTGFLVATQARRYREGSERGQIVRYLGTGAVVAAFIAATLTLFAPVSNVEVQTFFTILIAAIYAVAGCWFGLRYAAVGAALAALALGSFHFAPAHLTLIVPFLGGGALILGGLWMRRAW